MRISDGTARATSRRLAQPEVGRDRDQARVDRLVAAGLLRPAERPYRRVEPTIMLPEGMISLDLLDRDEHV
jgi:hypothetical protein